MLRLGDIVVPFSSERNSSQPLECTITEIKTLDSTGKYLYGVSSDTRLFPEDKMRLVQSNGLQLKYNIGDHIITDKHKDMCIRQGITNEMIPGTIDAMEARIVGMFLTGDGDIMYRYRAQTATVTINGTIDECEMPKHRQYSLF